MDVSTLGDPALPPFPRRRWATVGSTLGHRLLTGLVLAGSVTVPGGWWPGAWDECWARGWDGWWTPAPGPDGTDGSPTALPDRQVRPRPVRHRGGPW